MDATGERNARVVLTRFGGPEGLELREGEPLPEPGPGQVRVRVLAACVQFTDVIIRKGQYPELKERPPFTPGYDVVGVVEARGEGVELAIGERVADLTTTGSYARHRLLDASRVVRVPSEVDPAEAATLVLSWVTAYQLLHRHAKVKEGARVLIHGAAGAVGLALLELGRLHGLTMFGTARAEHAALIRSFGATPIDYRNEDFTEVLKDGVDVVFDGIGEAGYTRSWSVVRRGGFLSAYGFSAAVQSGRASLSTVGSWLARLALWNAWPNGKRAGFYSITRHRKKHPEHFREDLSALFELLRAGTIHPRVAERISLQGVADAQRRIEEGGLDGKMVITP